MRTNVTDPIIVSTEAHKDNRRIMKHLKTGFIMFRVTLATVWSLTEVEMFMALHKWAPGCARTASQEHHTVSCLIHEHHRCEELNNKVFFCWPAV